MKKLMCFILLIGGCTSSSNPNVDEILTEKDVYLNSDQTSILALKKGMPVDIAIQRLEDQGFNEKSLVLRSRPYWPSEQLYTQKTENRPPTEKPKKTCSGLDYSYTHNYYRDESQGTDLIYSAVRLSQGSMLINGDCAFSVVTDFSPVRTYTIRDVYPN